MQKLFFTTEVIIWSFFSWDYQVNIHLAYSGVWQLNNVTFGNKGGIGWECTISWIRPLAYETHVKVEVVQALDISWNNIEVYSISSPCVYDGFCFEVCLNAVRLLCPSKIHLAWKSNTFRETANYGVNLRWNFYQNCYKNYFFKESSVIIRIKINFCERGKSTGLCTFLLTKYLYTQN